MGYKIQVKQAFRFCTKSNERAFSPGIHDVSEEIATHPWIQGTLADGHIEQILNLPDEVPAASVVAMDGDQDETGEDESEEAGDEEGESAEGAEPSAEKPRRGRARKA